MNASDMLDYVLGQLDGPSSEVAEREIGEDPVVAERVDRLRGAVGRLLDDGLDDIEPPGDLARRTASFVEEEKEIKN